MADLGEARRAHLQSIATVIDGVCMALGATEGIRLKGLESETLDKFESAVRSAERRAVLAGVREKVEGMKMVPQGAGDEFAMMTNRTLDAVAALITEMEEKDV